jgi:Tfp pilus assembly protein PilN
MRIDLLPPELRPQSLVNPRRLLGTFIAILLITGSLSGLVYEYFQTETAKDNLQRITQQALTYQSMLQEVETASQKKQQLQQRKAELTKITGYYSSYQDLLNQLAAATPAKVWLLTTNFPASGGMIAITGRSLSFALVGNYLTNLKKAADFGAVQLIQIKKITEDKVVFYEFTIEIISAGGGTLEYAKDQNP